MKLRKITLLIFIFLFLIPLISVSDQVLTPIRAGQEQLNNPLMNGSTYPPNPSGFLSNGTPICIENNIQSNPQICSDGAGGAIITWKDSRTDVYSRIYAQRINASGAVQWTTNGVAICININGQMAPMICSDGTGGAIITWIDWRSGSRSIYAQRVDASGVVQWTANGVAISASTFELNLQLCSDGAGGAIITWEDSRSSNIDIYAQRVDGNGVVKWTSNGVAITNIAYHQQYPQICSDGVGGAIITWEDRGSNTYNIYAQRINGSGAIKWAANGIAICTANNAQYKPQICSDGAGGALITWEDTRNGPYDIYAQHINASGTSQWAANGIAVCAANNGQYSPKICSDGAGGALITWGDNRSNNLDIYAQRIDATGMMLWAANGTAACKASGG
ncbi:MAG TPA: hypothetical protein VMV49_04485, partial [Candidatus Deferrimicrobium sp.]|nr:hypothetical protein [Candidatus Deferrimicrobium sp.]